MAVEQESSAAADPASPRRAGGIAPSVAGLASLLSDASWQDLFSPRRLESPAAGVPASLLELAERLTGYVSEPPSDPAKGAAQPAVMLPDGGASAPRRGGPAEPAREEKTHSLPAAAFGFPPPNFMFSLPATLAGPEQGPFEQPLLSDPERGIGSGGPGRSGVHGEPVAPRDVPGVPTAAAEQADTAGPSAADLLRDQVEILGEISRHAAEIRVSLKRLESREPLAVFTAPG